MENIHISSQIILKSSLTPEQLRIQSLWHECEVKIDSKTFLHIWRLSELGIPSQFVLSLLKDIAMHGKKRV